MRHDVLIAGFGGQGVLLMGQLIAEAAMDEGLHVTWFPSYGPEMRGGTANCTTVYSDEEIGSPIAAQYDYVIAMNQPSMERFSPHVRPGGTLLVNESMVPVRYEHDEIRVIYVPLAEIANQVGNERVGNVAMLGAFLALEPSLGSDAFEKAIRQVIGIKRADTLDANLAALRAGRRAVIESESPSPAAIVR